MNSKVVVLSGLGPGTGIALTRAFATAGAHLVLASRSGGLAEQAIDIAKDAGVDAIHVNTDITSVSDCEALIAQAEERFGGVDTLINNAFTSGRHSRIEDTPIEKGWKSPFQVNLFGTLQMTRAAIPALKRRGGGSVVMINTQNARKTQEKLGAYAASKAALLSAAQTLAIELGGYNIRVNSVVPSHIDGPNLRYYFGMLAQQRGITEEEVEKEIIELGTLNHITTTPEVASVALFLASDAASAVTGQALNVNCGQLFS